MTSRCHDSATMSFDLLSRVLAFLGTMTIYGMYVTFIVSSVRKQDRQDRPGMLSLNSGSCCLSIWGRRVYSLLIGTCSTA